jgi:membrane protease YdiL (CAAX protease family)
MGLPSVHDSSDEGNRYFAIAGVVGVLVLVPLVIFFQQFLRDQSGTTITTPLPEIARNERAIDPGVGELVVTSKLFVKMMYLRHDIESSQPAVHGPKGTAPYDGAAMEDDPEEVDTPSDMVGELDQMAHSRVDRLRVALVAGELLGADAALDRLLKLKEEAEPGGELEGDLAWFVPWYKGIVDGKPQTLTPDAQQALRGRHGWFAEIALTLGNHPSDAVRWHAVSGGKRIIAFITSIELLGVVLGLGGIGVAITLIAKYSRGTIAWQLERPNIPEGIYLEMFAVFCLGFMLLLATSVFVLGRSDTWAIILQETLQWSLGLAVFWPILRGVAWSDWRADLGLTLGQGLFREIGAGVLGYLAGIPLTIIAAIVANLIESVVVGKQEAPTAGFPMFEQPDGASWAGAIIGTLGAIMWAPVLEEIFFRGAFYQFLRPRVGWGLSILISAGVFGFYHPYSLAGLLQVSFAGVMFALLREWRSSLIAPMTAHFLHNASLSISTIGILAMLE